MRAQFYDTTGVYIFATRDDPPTREDILRMLRALARSSDFVSNLRRQVGSLPLPSLMISDDDEFLQHVADNMVRGAYRFLEAPRRLLPPRYRTLARTAALEPPAPAMTRTTPARLPALRPRPYQADAFRKAAQSGAPFCKQCQRIQQAETPALQPGALAESAQQRSTTPLLPTQAKVFRAAAQDMAPFSAKCQRPLQAETPSVQPEAQATPASANAVSPTQTGAPEAQPGAPFDPAILRSLRPDKPPPQQTQADVFRSAAEKGMAFCET